MPLRLRPEALLIKMKAYLSGEAYGPRGYGRPGLHGRRPLPAGSTCGGKRREPGVSLSGRRLLQQSPRERCAWAL